MDSLSWVSHPAAVRRKAATLTLLLIGVILVVVYFIAQSILMVFLALLIFTGALSTFFFPTKYQVDHEKVRIKYMFTSVEKELSMFRSFYPDKNGVLLSPFTRPSRLENFRGLYLRYHRNKEEVDNFVKQIFEERQDAS
jgi:hypothetical protein